MNGLRLTKAEREQRLLDCIKYKYNPDKLSELWGIQDKSCMDFMRKNCRKEYFKAMADKEPEVIVREKPEYENQWLLDLEVLTQAEYMAKYHLSRNAYSIKLYRARKEYGEICTPKQRAKWDKEYWRAM